jgi:hypothetical protein
MISRAKNYDTYCCIALNSIFSSNSTGSCSARRISTRHAKTGRTESPRMATCRPAVYGEAGRSKGCGYSQGGQRVRGDVRRQREKVGCENGKRSFLSY